MLGLFLVKYTTRPVVVLNLPAIISEIALAELGALIAIDFGRV